MQSPPTHGTRSTKGCEVWRGIWKWFYVHPTADMDAGGWTLGHHTLYTQHLWISDSTV